MRKRSKTTPTMNKLVIFRNFFIRFASILLIQGYWLDTRNGRGFILELENKMSESGFFGFRDLQNFSYGKAF